MLKKLIIILIALLILGIYVQQHTNLQNVKPTHEERVEVVGEEREPISTEELPKDIAKASWYDRTVCNGNPNQPRRIYGSTCKTANGEIFDEEAYTMACSYDFSLGDRVELCYLSKCIISECTDRGNFERLGITFDLSRGLFGAFADLSLGVITVSWKIK